MGSACLSADACSKKCVLDLRQRTKPTRTAHESHPSILRDLSEVLHAGYEWYEQAPSLNQELEEKIASTQSWMVAHVREGGRGSAPAARRGARTCRLEAGDSMLISEINHYISLSTSSSWGYIENKFSNILFPCKNWK